MYPDRIGNTSEPVFVQAQGQAWAGVSSEPRHETDSAGISVPRGRTIVVRSRRESDLFTSIGREQTRSVPGLSVVPVKAVMSAAISELVCPDHEWLSPPASNPHEDQFRGHTLDDAATLLSL